MDDLISKQAAIDAIRGWVNKAFEDWGNAETEIRCFNAIYPLIMALPSAQPEPHYDEWCTDCKEYDSERHCCPRFNRVIRETLKDAQPEIIYCEECKHYNAGFECLIEGYGIERNKDWFCGDAERRTDETD